MSSVVSKTIIPFRDLSLQVEDYSDEDKVGAIALKALSGSRLEEPCEKRPSYTEGVLKHNDSASIIRKKEDSFLNFELDEENPSARRKGSVALPEERVFEIRREVQNLTESKNLALVASNEISTDPEAACTHLLNAAKLHYETAASTLMNWINEGKISEEQTDLFFKSIKSALDEHRYVNVDSQKAKILHLVEIIETKCPNRLSLKKDLTTLIDCVGNLLKDLKIQYHNIQHTLEVTLGTIQAVSRRVENGLVRDPKTALLPVIAALFHDIGYSNSRVVVDLVKGLSKEQYEPLFLAAKGQGFIKDFEREVEKMQRGEMTGAEMHKYHVQLSQVLFPLIISSIPDNELPHKEFLLRSNSIEKICAMIALTDVKPDVTKYREDRREFLDKHGLLTAANCLVTSDLLTQLSTSDRLSKGLALYHEFYLGQDARFWSSGLSLMSTACGFYEHFAKSRFNPQSLALLDGYFSSTNDLNTTNPYRQGNELIFFFHKLLEPLYEKLTSGKTIEERDLHILNGLRLNGLQKEVVDLFILTQALRNGESVPFEVRESLDRLLQDKGSLLEISIGDEVRISMMLGAQSCSEMISYLDLYRPELLVARSADFLEAYRRMNSKEESDRLLAEIKVVVKKIPEGTNGLIDFERALFPRKTECCLIS
jgi:hypothetical protein